MATHIATARPTPIHTQRSALVRPWVPRKAAMIPMMREASTPSRRPITKVGSISSQMPVAGEMATIPRTLGNPITRRLSS